MGGRIMQGIKLALKSYSYSVDEKLTWYLTTNPPNLTEINTENLLLRVSQKYFYG